MATYVWKLMVVLALCISILIFIFFVLIETVLFQDLLAVTGREQKGHKK